MNTMTTPELPVRVKLVTEPWGIWKSLQVARRNILELIPEIATRQPIVSGKTGKRRHMVMDPNCNRRIVLERLDDCPKSDVTKYILRPAVGDSLFAAEGAHWRWLRRAAAAPVFSACNIAAPGTEHDRFAHLPFGNGPRICIGAGFAVIEAVIILATLAARFRFERVPGRDPEPVPILTTRPEGGVWLKIEPLDRPVFTALRAAP